MQPRERVPSLVPSIEKDIDAQISLHEGEILYNRTEIKKLNKLKRTIDRIEDQLDDLPLLNGFDVKTATEPAITFKETL